jgi:hypothetical protein
LLQAAVSDVQWRLRAQQVLPMLRLSSADLLLTFDTWKFCSIFCACLRLAGQQLILLSSCTEANKYVLVADKPKGKQDEIFRSLLHGGGITARYGFFQISCSNPLPTSSKLSKLLASVGPALQLDIWATHVFLAQQLLV